MIFKGGVYFLDFTGIDLTGSGEDIPGFYDKLKVIKGKPIYVYAALSGIGIEGFAACTWNDANGLISLTVSGMDPITGTALAIEFDISDEAGISSIVPTINVFTPDSE